jgi:hypothetical protein
MISQVVGSFQKVEGWQYKILKKLWSRRHTVGDLWTIIFHFLRKLFYVKN